MCYKTKIIEERNGNKKKWVETCCKSENVASNQVSPCIRQSPSGVTRSAVRSGGTSRGGIGYFCKTSVGL